MRQPTLVSLALTALFAASASAQVHSISPGMSRAQVIAALGQPITLRQADGYTYIFYKNTCTRACGMNDLVVLRSDSVVDAIFRSPDRHYTGTSSSPTMIPARVAAHGKTAAAAVPPKKVAAPVKSTTAPAPVTTMKPGAPNDVHPSIPVNPPQLKPAPAPAPDAKPPVKKP